MKIDGSGNYQTFERDVNNIDFYINEFVCFTDLLKSLLRKDPETREAILNASYKDVLCLRVQAAQVRGYLRLLEDRRTLQADAYEAESCAGEHPLTYGND